MNPLFASAENDTLENLLHGIGDAVCISDENMVFLGANQRFAAFYGLQNPAELLGKSAFEVYPEFRRSVFYEACSNTIKTGETTSRVGYSQNLKTWVVSRAYKYQANRYAMVVHRLSEGTTMAGYVTQHDTLTSLPNRWAFEQDAHSLNGYKQSIVMALIDIAHFKNLNETLGLQTGDRCLMEVGARIRGAMPSSDRVYRVGDDQFLIVTTHGKAEMQAGLRRVSEVLAQPLLLQGKEIVLQFNVGLCSPVITDTGLEALNKAERALTHAKEHRLGFAEYSPDMLSSTYDPLLTKEIKDALLRNELELYFQPQIDLVGGKVCGAEALIRWNHPEKGFISPDAFLPFAERTGLIQDIDRFVLQQAFRHMQGLQAEGAPLHLAINLSAQSICDVDTIRLVRQLLADTGVPASSLCIEITETSLMRDIQTSQKVIEELKAMGLQIAIDDFGSGYSSMAYLVRYPSNFLKIDRGFIQNLTTCETHRVMVRNMIGLAKGLRICVVAEGVETEEQRALLEQFGCDVVQGYLYSPPLSAQKFRDWTQAHGSASMRSTIW